MKFCAYDGMQYESSVKNCRACGRLLTERSVRESAQSDSTAQTKTQASSTGAKGTTVKSKTEGVDNSKTFIGDGKQLGGIVDDDPSRPKNVNTVLPPFHDLKHTWFWLRRQGRKHLLGLITLTAFLLAILTLLVSTPVVNLFNKMTHDPPTIIDIETYPQEILPGESVRLTPIIPNGDRLRYYWNCTDGHILGSSPPFTLTTQGIQRTAPFPIYVSLTVEDAYGRKSNRFDRSSPISIVVKNHPKPILKSVRPEKLEVRVGEPNTLIASAEGTDLHYEWYCTGGHFDGNTDSPVITINTSGISSLLGSVPVTGTCTAISGNERSNSLPFTFTIRPTLKTLRHKGKRAMSEKHIIRMSLSSGGAASNASPSASPARPTPGASPPP